MWKCFVDLTKEGAQPQEENGLSGRPDGICLDQGKASLAEVGMGFYVNLPTPNLFLGL